MENPNLVQKFIWFAERSILLLIALATLYAVGFEIFRIIVVREVNLSDLFLLFIYAEVLGMVATFYANNRIPVTLPLIIAMTALTRMIILQSKDLNAINISPPQFACIPMAKGKEFKVYFSRLESYYKKTFL